MKEIVKMKTSLKFLVVAAIGSIGFSLFAADDNRVLTDKERQAALQGLDDICADLWCEGEFDFSFNAIKCDKSTGKCSVELEFVDFQYDETGEIQINARVPHKCEITGFFTKDDLLYKTRNGALDVTVEFFVAVGICIDEQEPLARLRLNEMTEA